MKSEEYLKGFEAGRKEILTQIAEEINSGHITQLAIYNDSLLILKEPVNSSITTDKDAIAQSKLDTDKFIKSFTSDNWIFKTTKKD